MIENPKALRDAAILLALIAQSEQALHEGRWLSQEELEEELRERFGI